MSSLVTPTLAPSEVCLPTAPCDLAELQYFFPDSECCAAFLAGLRWPEPDGFRCQRCGASKWWPARDLRECSGCSAQYSVLSGSAFHMTKVSLSLWFQALWWLVEHKGIPRLVELRRILQANNFEMARPLLAKMGAAISYRDGVAGCLAVKHYGIAGYEIIVGVKPIPAGGHEVRLHAFPEAGQVPFQKHLRSSLGFRGPSTPPPKKVRGPNGAQGCPPEHETLGVEEQVIKRLERRLAATPDLPTWQLQVALNVVAFQINHPSLSVGELWRLALLFALRPVKGRGLPAWPPVTNRMP